MVQNEEFHVFTIHFEPPKRRQPLYKGLNAWSQGVDYGCSTVHVHVHVCLLACVQ